MPSKDPSTLTTLLDRYLERFPAQSELRKGMALHRLPEILGPGMAQACVAAKFEGNVLVIKVTDPGWRHEMHLMRYRIRQRLNDTVGSDLVSEVRVRG